MVNSLSFCTRILVAILIFTPALTFAQTREGVGYETFTNPNGVAIEARILDVKNDSVYLERKDGQRFTIEKTTLSDSGQAYVNRWVAKAPLRDPARFKIRVIEKEHTEYLDRGAVINGVPARKEWTSFSVAFHNETGARIGEFTVIQYEVRRLPPAPEERPTRQPKLSVENLSYSISHLEAGETLTLPATSEAEKKIRAERFTTIRPITFPQTAPEEGEPEVVGMILRVFADGMFVQEVHSRGARRYTIQFREES